MNVLGNSAEDALILDIAGFTCDPLGFVRYAFAWGEGELSGRKPDSWQVDILSCLGEKLRLGKVNASEAIQLAVASGHGIGKSALVAWLILWALSTFEDTKGIVTANTENQLKTKTWAELAKWYRLCICRHWFRYTATAIYSADAEHEKIWRIDMIPWSERNTEAFAGLHNKGKRIIIVYDEASAIPEVIWEVTEGALTDEDTQIIWCVFGNPTRNTGRFYTCFGRFRHRWLTRQIDGRTVAMTNKGQLGKWAEDYGEDSDFFRVRVRGVFPRGSDMQVIPSDWVALAQKRTEFYSRDDALILGVDVARGGSDNNVIFARRGSDARSIRPLIIPGSETRDSMRLVAKIVTYVADVKPDAVILDSTGLGGPIADRLRQLGVNVFDVNFASRAMSASVYANIRAEMWFKLREALRLDLAICDDMALETELTSPEYGYDIKNRILLEGKDAMKKRGLASPDRADALALTYAIPVIRGMGGYSAVSYTDHYNPLADL